MEEFCFARICDGFIQLGLSSNLDLSPFDDTSKHVMVKDETDVISFGTYKNGVFGLLKIPFFKREDAVEGDDQICLAFQQISGTSGTVRVYTMR